MAFLLAIFLYLSLLHDQLLRKVQMSLGKLVAVGRGAASFGVCDVWNGAPRTLEHKRSTPSHDSVLAKTRMRLDFLNDEIGLREPLAELEEPEERASAASLTAYNAQIREILSPLRGLPPVPLAEILSWALAITRGHDTFNVGDCP
ncbi:hypothetical protein B0H11DRAFT_2226302 [Mycena galericulata]|nr:hypothetical protein B0H11DRAFT_2226302 [Mycena galericulata]